MECDVVKKNLGVSRCNKMPEMLVGMITTPNDFIIPAETLNDPVALLTLLNEAALADPANRIYYWPDFKGFENVSVETVYEDTPLAYLPVRDGNYRFKFMIRENLCLHKAMYTHRANSGRVIFIDSENQLFLSENSAGDGIGFKIQVLHTEKLVFNDGSVASKSPVLVALQNNKEIDKSGIVVAFDNYGEVYRLVDAKLTLVGSPSTTLITVKAAAECDGTPIVGLALADFLLLDDDTGASHAITSATEDPAIPGQYALVGVGYEASKLSFIAPADLTVKPYETIAPLQITPGALFRRGNGPDEGNGGPERPVEPEPPIGGGELPDRPSQQPPRPGQPRPGSPTVKPVTQRT